MSTIVIEKPEVKEETKAAKPKPNTKKLVARAKSKPKEKKRKVRVGFAEFLRKLKARTKKLGIDWYIDETGDVRAMMTDPQTKSSVEVCPLTSFTITEPGDYANAAEKIGVPYGVAEKIVGAADLPYAHYRKRLMKALNLTEEERKEALDG